MGFGYLPNRLGLGLGQPTPKPKNQFSKIQSNFIIFNYFIMSFTTLALQTLTQADIEFLFEKPAKYAPETIRKHIWVNGIYSQFCVELRREAWPLTPTTVSAFIRFLAYNAHYKISSIEDVIIPSLKRIHESDYLDLLGPLQADVINAMSLSLADARRNCNDQKNCGKDAAILADVEWIINCTPKSFPARNEEASCWLVAVSTGARAITIENVLIKHITNVTKSATSSISFVQLKFMVTKGNYHWNHVVCLEGDLDDTSSTNAVYFLNQHLIAKFNLNLKCFQSWNIDSQLGNRKIWKWNVDTLRETFKIRAIMAGFPRLLLAFHSLRSGFICSALIKANLSGANTAGILENTGFVAGWTNNSKAQLNYVRKSAIATISATRLIGAHSPSNVVAEELTTSVGFHNLKKPLVSGWSNKMIFSGFEKEFSDWIYIDEQTPIWNGNWKNHIFTMCFSKLVASHQHLKRQITKTLTKKGLAASKVNATGSTCRQFIAEQIGSDPEAYDYFLDLFKTFAGHMIVNERSKANSKGVQPSVIANDVKEWNGEEFSYFKTMQNMGFDLKEIAAWLPERTYEEVVALNAFAKELEK